MQLPSQRIGLTTVDSTFNVFMSDFDGHDLSLEFMDRCAAIRADRNLWYTPIKFYIASGTLGYIHAEQLIVYVDAGTIFILSSLPSFDGSDYAHAALGSDGELMVTRLFNGKSRVASSLGIVPDGTDIMTYAKDYYTGNGIVTDGQINSEQVLMFLDQWEDFYHGNLYVTGGHLYGVYAVDCSVSAAIRYVRGDNSFQFAGKEVLLVGGIPEIMPLGYHTNMFGHTFKVWTANDIDRFNHAKRIFEGEWLPTDLFDIDLDEMAEAYALHAEKMRRDDPTENLDAFSGGGAEAAPPVVDEGDGNYDHLVHLGGVDSTEKESE